MKSKFCILSFLVLLLFGSVWTQVEFVCAFNQVEASDFEEEFWSKSIDLIEYARERATEQGKKPPPEGWSSGIRLNYINLYGVKVLYAGFEEVALDKFSLTLPLQAFVEHFKTRDGLHAVTASSFLMMMAYNETEESLFPDSPDEKDRLWASFNLGRDLTEFFGGDAPQRLISDVEVIPLSHSEDKLEWSWGMRYTNLSAIWWGLEGRREAPGFNRIPVAFSIYDELGFQYKLVFNPGDGVANLHLSYTIGEMRDLWILHQMGFIPIIAHYNDTGCFLGRRHKISEENIHDFLRKNDIDVSLVLFQRNLVIDHQTVSMAEGENLSNGSIDVSQGSIQTITDTGEKMFEVNFGTKEQYKLFNSTSGSTKVLDAVTRTSEIQYYARNPVIEIQTSLLRLMPWIIRRMVPPNYEERVEGLLNITKVDYLYITSYPVFEGYRIEHDPVMTAYFEAVKEPKEPLNQAPMHPILLALGVIGVIAVLLLIKKK